MNRPWMPLYIADYLADTVHLTTIEHGCYLLLIMSYWKENGLPIEDNKLARICRMTPAQWAEVRETLAELFQDDWTHTRIDAELSKVVEISAKRRDARSKVGKRPTPERQVSTHVEQDQTVVETNEGLLTTHSHSHSHSHSESQEEVVGLPADDGRPALAAATSKARHAPEDYFISEGDFRVLEVDVVKWIQAFPNIEVRSELFNAAGWAITKFGTNWYYPLRSWLAKKNREAGQEKANAAARAVAEAEAGLKPRNSRFQIPRNAQAA